MEYERLQSFEKDDNDFLEVNQGTLRRWNATHFFLWSLGILLASGTSFFLGKLSVSQVECGRLLSTWCK
jgi:hypothetical protein